MLRKSVSLSFLALLAAGGSYAYRIGIARLLGQEAYGTVAVALALVNLVSLVLLSAIPPAIAKFRAEGKKVFGASYYFAILGALLGVLLIVASPLLSWTDLPFSLLVLIAAALPIGMMMAVGRGLLQGAKRTDAFGVSQALQEISKFVIALGLILGGYGIFGAVAGIPLSFVLVLAFVFFLVRKERERASFTEFKRVVKYALPIAVTRVVDAFILNIDLLFLKMWFPLGTVAMYAAAGPLARIPLIAFSSIATVLLPEVSARKDKTKALTKKASLISILVLFGILVLIAFPQYFIILFGSEYVTLETILVLRILALASFFIGLYKIFAASLQGLGKAKEVAVFTLLVLLIDVLLNVSLIPVYGMVGAAASTLFASVIAAGGAFLILKRLG